MLKLSSIPWGEKLQKFIEHRHKIGFFFFFLKLFFVFENHILFTCVLSNVILFHMFWHIKKFTHFNYFTGAMYVVVDGSSTSYCLSIFRTFVIYSFFYKLSTICSKWFHHSIASIPVKILGISFPNVLY